MRRTNKTRICIICSLEGELSEDSVKEVIKQISDEDLFRLVTGMKKIHKITPKSGYVVISPTTTLGNKITKYEDTVYMPGWINGESELFVSPEIKKELSGQS